MFIPAQPAYANGLQSHARSSNVVKLLRVFSSSIIIVGSALGLNVFQLLSMLLKPFARSKVIKFNAFCAGVLWYLLQSIFELQDSAKVTLSGDAIPRNENALIISNHVRAADFLLINYLSIRRGMLQHCKYFIKEQLKYMPGFGWGMWFVGMIFLNRSWDKDKKHIVKQFDWLRTNKIATWLVLYPEGTRITRTKILESQVFSRERGMSVLNNLLAPRTKGFCLAVKSLKESHIKHIYDFTLAYRRKPEDPNEPDIEATGQAYPPASIIYSQDESAPSLTRILNGPLSDYDFHIHARRFLLSSLPESEVELRMWLRDRWREKELILSTIRQEWVLDNLEKVAADGNIAIHPNMDVLGNHGILGKIWREKWVGWT